MKFTLLSFLILSSFALSAKSQAADGGISSGGDDPTNWMLCSGDLGEAGTLNFAVSDDGYFGYGGVKQIELTVKNGEKTVATQKIKFNGRLATDENTGTLYLAFDALTKHYGYTVKILAEAQDRGRFYYYQGRLETQDPVFAGLKNRAITCQVDNRKGDGAGPGDVEL